MSSKNMDRVWRQLDTCLSYPEYHDIEKWLIDGDIDGKQVTPWQVTGSLWTTKNLFECEALEYKPWMEPKSNFIKKIFGKLF
jgi:hypothetical protein